MARRKLVWSLCYYSSRTKDDFNERSKCLRQCVCHTNWIDCQVQGCLLCSKQQHWTPWFASTALFQLYNLIKNCAKQNRRRATKIRFTCWWTYCCMRVWVSARCGCVSQIVLIRTKKGVTVVGSCSKCKLWVANAVCGSTGALAKLASIGGLYICHTRVDDHIIAQ